MKRIIVSTFVICLLLTTMSIGSVASKAVEENVKCLNLGITYYVDDDNFEGPWYGTSAYPFFSISQGIQNANDGDILIVREGKYVDGIFKIHEQIKIIGENNKKTTIECYNNEGFIISGLSGGSVTIEGFTIEMHKHEGVTIEVYPDCKVILKDNIIMWPKDGDPDKWCIAIQTHDNAVIRNNKFINAYVDIDGSNNNIQNNEFTEFSHQYGALDIDGGSNNIIKENTFYDNLVGLSIVDSSENQVYHNNFVDNSQNIIEGFQDDPLNNVFDDGEKKGNYFNGYTMKYPDAQKLFLNGIWDTPYKIDANFLGSFNENSFDRYPLIRPCNNFKDKSPELSKPVYLQFLDKLINKLPNAFPILRQLVEL